MRNQDMLKIMFLLIFASIFFVARASSSIIGLTPTSPTSCEPTHDHLGCYGNNVYWYDSCNNKTDFVKNCGSDYCSSWGPKYCKSGDVYKNRTCYDRGCDGGLCYSHPHIEYKLVNNCSSNEKCISGFCRNGSEFNFNVVVSESYPNSAIPIKVSSSVWPTNTNVDFNFTLNGVDISNNVGDGICNLQGDPRWFIADIGHVCETKVPANFKSGTYQLKAKWHLLTDHEKIINVHFPVKKEYIWSSAYSNHGGFVSKSIVYSKKFTKKYYLEGSSYKTCVGNSLNANIAGTIITECSDGATSSRIPALLSWVYKDGNKIATSNNNMFNGCCKIRKGTDRNNLINSVKGYMPESSKTNCSCDISWVIGGSKSFNIYNFNSPGEYYLYLDYINAVSDSPDYICPGKGDLCVKRWGHKAINAKGISNLEQLKVSVIDPELNSVGNVISNANKNGSLWNLNIIKQGNKIKRNFTIDWKIKNSGIGRVKILNYSLNCPGNMNCSKITAVPLSLDEGKDITLTTVFEMPLVPETEQINLSILYQNDYGLSCGANKTLNESLQVKWNDTRPPKIFCDNCHKVLGSSIIFTPKAIDPEPSAAGVSSVKICADKVCKTILCSLGNKSSCNITVGGCSIYQKEYWVQATDFIGNMNITKGGIFEVKKALDCSCSYSSECGSGRCGGVPKLCLENPIPELYFV